MKSITDALDELNKRVEDKQLHKGDVVAVVISSHVLELSGDTLVTAADSVPGRAPRSSRRSPRVSSPTCWAGSPTTAAGCCSSSTASTSSDPKFKSSIKAWVRDLRQNRRVITFVASKEGPAT